MKYILALSMNLYLLNSHYIVLAHEDFHLISFYYILGSFTARNCNISVHMFGASHNA